MLSAKNGREKGVGASVHSFAACRPTRAARMLAGYSFRSGVPLCGAARRAQAVPFITPASRRPADRAPAAPSRSHVARKEKGSRVGDTQRGSAIRPEPGGYYPRAGNEGRRASFLSFLVLTIAFAPRNAHSLHAGVPASSPQESCDPVRKTPNSPFFAKTCGASLRAVALISGCHHAHQVLSGPRGSRSLPGGLRPH